MRFLTSLLLFLSLCFYSWALHESDVGVVDWHKHLIGVPLSGAVETAPSFVVSGNKSLIITATANNVLAALEPENGAVLWRYLFDPEDRIAGYYKNSRVVATLSGPGGATLRTFDVLTGELLLEKILHLPEQGAHSEPSHFGLNIILLPNSTDLYVLTNGYVVRCIDGISGDLKWIFSSPDQSSFIIHSKLILTTEALFAIGFAKSTQSFTLHITSMSPSTGEVIKSANVAANFKDPVNEFLALTRPGLSRPVVYWLEQGTLKHVPLTPLLKDKPKPIKGVGFAKFVDVGLKDHGYAVIERTDGSSFVVEIDDSNSSAKSAWEFAESAKSKDNAPSRYTGGIDARGRTYVARVYWSYKHEKGTADVFARHLMSGKGLSSDLYFPFDTKTHGILSHVAIDPDYPADSTSQSRLLVTSSTGSLQLWEQGEIKWTREESLAAIVIAEFVEIPENLVNNGEIGAAEGFLARVIRQISDARDFPQYVVNFAKRFATGSYASPTAVIDLNKPKDPNTFTGTQKIFRDTFGFRQIIVAATAFGKVYGIDSSNGEIVWSRVLGLGWANEIGGKVTPIKLYVTKTVSDGGDPGVVLVGHRRADNSLTDTIVFHLDAMTGSDVTGVSKDDALLEGHDIVPGPIVDSYLLNGEQKVVIMLDEFMQVYLYPDNSKSNAAFAKAVPNLSFPIRTTVEDRKCVLGHRINLSTDLHKSLAYSTWSFTLPKGEDIQQLIPQVRSPVASIGKVLGNRTTLYKYLNTRLFTMLTVSPATGLCGIYVLDSTKGTLVYHSAVKANGRGCDVKPILVENWLVYHYYEGELPGGNVGGSTGYRMVSVEFYEGQKVDEKIESSDLSSYSNDTLNFRTLEQSFIFPYAISALATTSTKYGISSKDIIVATLNHRIQSFPRRLLDPRRPVNRRPTPEEQEEFLFQYDAVLPNDPKRVLSHNYKVANVQKIVTSPALLESTSLVLAFGLDVFLTKVAPSNTFDILSENFNKVQLVLTVSGLLVAILITRPMVRRKILREKWYQ